MKRKFKIIFIFCGVMFFGFTISSALAGPQPISQRIVEYRVQSGVQENLGTKSLLAFRKEIKISGAPWLRLQFDDFNLGKKSYIHITNKLDGAEQKLDAQALIRWHKGSAYFNGNTLEVELHVEPGEKNIFFNISKVTRGEKSKKDKRQKSTDQESLMTTCGSDDRVRSTDVRVARILPVGCTAWLIGNRAFLTAGHCVDLDPDDSGPQLPDGIVDTAQLQVIEFNVPSSTSDGDTVPSAPQDQYPIDLIDNNQNGVPDSMKFRFEGEGRGFGKDWAVFDVLYNNNCSITRSRSCSSYKDCPSNETCGAFPSFVQGDFFRLTQRSVNTQDLIRVTGFGTDEDPPGNGWWSDRNSDNQTNQTSTGPYVARGSDGTNLWHEYQVDTEGGNSGSPIILEAVNNGLTIGIHTNGGCSETGGNAGTSFNNQDLAQAINQFAGSNVVYVDPNTLESSENGTIFAPYNTLQEGLDAVSSGEKVYIVPGQYFYNSIKGKRLRLVAPLGRVKIKRSP